MQVDLPICLGIGGQRQVLAGLLAGDAGLDSGLIHFASVVLQFPFGECEGFAQVWRKRNIAALPIARRLRPPLARRCGLSGIDSEGITCAVLIYASRTMSYPLSPAVHGDADEEFDFRHFKWRGVAVPEEVADQGAVV